MSVVIKDTSLQVFGICIWIHAIWNTWLTVMPLNRILKILFLEIVTWLNKGINTLHVYMFNLLEYNGCI